MNRRSIPLFDMELSMIEKGTSGTTILFLHGSSLSSESFINQHTEPQFSGFRFIAPDFPGHGATAKAKNPDKTYNLIIFRDVLLYHFVQSLL